MLVRRRVVQLQPTARTYPTGRPGAELHCAELHRAELDVVVIGVESGPGPQRK